MEVTIALKSMGLGLRKTAPKRTARFNENDVSVCRKGSNTGQRPHSRVNLSFKGTNAFEQAGILTGKNGKATRFQVA